MPLEGQLLTAYWVITRTKALTGLDCDRPYTAVHNDLDYKSNTPQSSARLPSLLVKTEVVPTG